jgi:hypothetical protein
MYLTSLLERSDLLQALISKRSSGLQINRQPAKIPKGIMNLLMAIPTKKEKANALRKASEYFVRTSKAADSYLITLVDDFINKSDRDSADAVEREGMNSRGDLQSKVGKAKLQVHSFYTRRGSYKR